MTASEMIAQFFCQTRSEALTKLANSATTWARIARVAMEKDQVEEPLLLPKVDHGITTWYAVATDDSQFRDFIEQVNAFIGPSYSDFRGRSATLDLSNPAEKALHEFAGRRVLKFSCPIEGQKQKDLGQKVNHLLKVRENRDFRRVQSARSTSRLLRDFDLALSNQNREEARGILNLLSEQLDALNRRFLEIKLHSALNEWGAIIADPEKNLGIVMMQRPVAVTEALIRSIWHTHLKRFEEDEDLNPGRQHLANNVLVPFRPLFANRGDMTHPDVLKAFMFVAAAESPPRGALKSELLGLVRDEKDREFMLRLGQFIPDTGADAVDDLMAAIRSALESEDVERAVQLVKGVNPGVDQVRTRLEIFAQTSAPSHAAAAAEAIKEIGEAEFQPIQEDPHLKDIVDSLKNLSGSEGNLPKAPPINWFDWLEGIRSQDWTASKARQFAEDGLTCWSIEPLKGAPQQFTKLLDAAVSGDASCERFYQGAPNLIRALQSDPEFPDRKLTSVYADVLVAFATYVSRRTVDDVLVVTSMFSALLEAGVTPKQFEELFDAVSEVVDDSLSDWSHGVCLDLVDVLLGSAIPTDSKERVRLWLTSFCSRSLDQIKRNPQNDGERELARAIMEQSGNQQLADAIPGLVSDHIASPLREFAGSIAVYTLTESVARRAIEVLKILAPNARVSSNSEKVGSKVLQSLAENADLFVVVTWSAKHAATEFIEARRPRGKTILRPDGKGVSSILRSIGKELESTAR